MPSPVERTVPVSLTPTCLPYPLICSRRMRLISSARISAIVLCSVSSIGSNGGVLELFAHALELRAQAAVELGRADLGDHAADQGRIGLRLEDDGPSRHARDRVAHARDLVLAEWPRRGDGGADAARLLVHHRPKGAGDLREIA